MKLKIGSLISLRKLINLLARLSKKKTTGHKIPISGLKNDITMYHKDT